jgi:tetratricopeptide (TPR) repeat protein
MIPRWAVHSALLAFAAGIYLFHLDGPFIYDDIPYIVENEDLRRLWPPDWLVAGGGDHAQVNGRPLLGFTLALNFAWGGLAVRGYHLVNIALHLCCGLILYAMLCQLLRRVDAVAEHAGELAFCSALLWTVHPLNSEVVYYTSQRSAALMGICYLATLYAFLRTTKGPRHWSVVAVCCCGLGMAAKEIMVSAPLVVLLGDRALSGGTPGMALRRRPWLYTGLAASWLIFLRTLWDRPHKDTIGFAYGVDGWTYLLNQAQMIATYLARIFWPHPLALDYGMPRPLTLGNAWLEGLLVVGFLLLVVWALWHRPLWGWAGAAFFLLLAPTSSFIPIVNEVGAERRMYLPLAVLVTALVVAGYTLLVRNRSVGWKAGVAVGLVAAILAWGTVRRGADYRSAVAIWQSAVAAQPTIGRAHLNLGSAVQKEGDIQAAVGHYRRALKLEPALEAGHFNLGSALQAMGEIQAAVGYYRRALELKPDYAKAHLNLGQIHKERGDFTAAERHYRQALALDPSARGVHDSLGKLFFVVGQYDSAAVYFRRVIALEPDWAEGHNSLGTVLAIQGQYRAAIDQYRRALAIDPGYARARDNMDKARRVLDER